MRGLDYQTGRKDAADQAKEKIAEIGKLIEGQLFQIDFAFSIIE
jgi:hypothetical protein